MKPFRAFIYVLRHPLTFEIRYVGYTSCPLHIRLQRHHAARNENNYRAHWIKQLFELGLRPIIQAIATWDNPNVAWEPIEQYFITEFRAVGIELLNATDGGKGIAGHHFTPSARVKMATAQAGRKHSPETCARISLSNRGKTFSPEVLANMAAGQRGRKHPPEVIAKLKLNRATDEARQKMSVAGRGRMKTAEHRAKIAASHSGMKQSPETIAKRAETRRRNQELRIAA